MIYRKIFKLISLNEFVPQFICSVSSWFQPIFVLKEEGKREASTVLPCPIADSRLTSGLLKIAALLGEGGVCGIPTDTVYALAASCKNPEAIEKIYNIKVKIQNKLCLVLVRSISFNLFGSYQERPAEKPICICISNVEQLVATHPPFSPLLWEFMRSVYPGGISCIVKKGEWLRKLGMRADAACAITHTQKAYFVQLWMHRSGTCLWPSRNHRQHHDPCPRPHCDGTPVWHHWAPRRHLSQSQRRGRQHTPRHGHQVKETEGKKKPTQS